MARSNASRLRARSSRSSGLERLRERVAAGRLKRPDRIHQAIGRLRERYPRVARYYAIDFDAATATFRAEPSAERRRLAERLDGGYILKTDRTDLGAEEAWLLYGQLTRTEQAFRDLKSPLGERPIFHQVARRVETHIFLCVLACHLLTAIEHTLRVHGVHTSWASVREALRTRQIVTVVLPDGAAPNGACGASPPRSPSSRTSTGGCRSTPTPVRRPPPAPTPDPPQEHQHRPCSGEKIPAR